MHTLMEDAITIEKEADSILERARIEAKQIERDCEDEIELYRKKKIEEMDEMLAAFQKKVEEDYIKSLSQYEDEIRETIRHIDSIPEHIIAGQIEMILSRLQEI